MTSNEPPTDTRTPWQRIQDLVRRDFPWMLLSLLLLALLLYTVSIAADHENQCDARYRQFAQTCYEATGAIPTMAYNLSNFPGLNPENRTNGMKWQISPNSR